MAPKPPGDTVREQARSYESVERKAQGVGAAGKSQTKKDRSPLPESGKAVCKRKKSWKCRYSPPAIAACLQAKKSRALAGRGFFKGAVGYQNAGTTAPLYFSRMNCFTSGLCRAAASFFMASLSLLSGRATRMFT